MLMHPTVSRLIAIGNIPDQREPMKVIGGENHPLSVHLCGIYKKKCSIEGAENVG